MPHKFRASHLLSHLLCSVQTSEETDWITGGSWDLIGSEGVFNKREYS